MTLQEYISKYKEKYGKPPSQEELSKRFGINRAVAVRAIIDHGKQKVEPKPVPPEPKKEQEDSTWTWLSIGLLIIAGLTFILSIYFTALWFMSMFPFYIAGAISIAMVSYMVLSPQAAERVKGFVSIPLWGTFAIALVFSMGSTVAGQYNQLTANVDLEVVNERALLESLEEEIAILEAQNENDQAQRQVHLDTMATLAAEDREANADMIRTERSRLDLLNSAIGTRQERIIELREVQRAELIRGTSGATVERVDFYSWLSGIINIPVNMVEFWIASLPAVFIDIIAALSLNMALALRRKINE